MDVILDDKELIKLYESGSSRKLKLSPNIIDKFFAGIQKIESAINIYDLWADPGLKFEKLHGFKNRYSMRLTGKYRLEMEVVWIDEKQTIAEFYIKTISNHYKD